MEFALLLILMIIVWTRAPGAHASAAVRSETVLASDQI